MSVHRQEGLRPDDTRSNPPGPTRRSVLTFMLAAPTLTLATRLGGDLLQPDAAHAGIPGTPGFAEACDGSDFLRIAMKPTEHLIVLKVGEDGHAVLELPRTEVGQGITTAMAMLVADELDLRLADVRVPLSDARPELMYNQFTGGSNSVFTLYQPVRTLAAEARARLVEAAAAQWGLPAASLRCSEGRVLAPDGRSAGYGSLAEAAAVIAALPSPVALKTDSEQRLIGRPTARIDARDIVTGRAQYTLDLDVAGAKPTVVARPPDLGGTVASFDDSIARRMPGVRGIAQIPSGVAVAADGFYEALKARDALRIVWNRGAAAELSGAEVSRALLGVLLPLSPAPPGVEIVDAAFEFAFVPHAPMEVQSAIADVHDDRAEIWTCCHSPIIAKQQIADALGLDDDAVVLHVVRGGSSFGSRLFFDAALEAAHASKAMRVPVKLMWTRADDMHHGRCRPACHHAIRATHAGGQVLSFQHHVASAELDFHHGLGEALTAGGFAAFPTLNQGSFALTQKVIYDFGLTSQRLTEVPLPVPTGSWRSVFSGTTVASNEIVVDMLARAIGVDPVRFRLTNLKRARTAAVLREVADAGRWGRRMPRGHAQGVACWEEYKGAIACLAEIDATDSKAPRVTKAVVAVDVGRAINPRGVEAQMLGGLTDGISTVLQAGLHLDSGVIREGSFADYHYARQRHSPPKVEVHVMPANGEPGGCGEFGVAAATGAIANAYARASGRVPRAFPINF